MKRARLALLVAGCAIAGCDGGPPDSLPVPLTRMHVDRTYLRDDQGRYLFFHGVNASCSSKLPAGSDPTTGLPTYVGRPFPLESARDELSRIRDLGFDSIRLLVLWEGVEPLQGQFDDAYLDYLRNIVRTAGDLGLHVLLDMHQDIFSRFLTAKYTRWPDENAATPGSMEYQLLSLVKPPDGSDYTDAVQGDGAPRWAVQACLQEKNFDSPNWGVPRILSGLDQMALNQLVMLYQKLTGSTNTGGPFPPWAVAFALGLPGKFEVNESTDMLPFTNWALAHALSLDVARCYACMLAGDVAFPGLMVGDKNVMDFLQDEYAAAWARVAERVADLPNVMGYDLMNEPGGNFLVLTAVAGIVKVGAIDGAKSALETLLGQATGSDVYDALLTLRLLPPDAMPDTLKKWGLDQLDPFNLLGLNNAFDENHLRPFYEKIARAILAADPNALFFIESTLSLASLSGGVGGIGGMWEFPMTHPQGKDLAGRFVYAPHWYADIYPNIGFNVDPRQFTVEEVRSRDYQPQLTQAEVLAHYSLGDIPVVFGEFGSYFNFNNTYEHRTYINRAAADHYQPSAAFLNNYYEAFESMFQSRMIWCYGTDNQEGLGDGWNHEDFSVLGPGGVPRAETVWARPHARALAGKPISTHFNSDLHYFDPNKGVPDPLREFEVRYASKETDAPTEIVVPALQYPDGFYVFVSDGICHYDPATSTLYHHPSRDEPGFEHYVRIRPPADGQSNEGWNYFFNGTLAVGGR
jgi:hypothetical protein